MGEAAARLRHRVGRRGSALLVFAALDVVIALRLAIEGPAAQPFYSWLHSWVTLWPWAALWLTAAACCAVSAFRDRDRIAFTVAIGIKVLWASLYASGWLLNEVEDGWVSTCVWSAFAACVWVIAGWPEPIQAKGAAWTPPLE